MCGGHDVQDWDQLEQHYSRVKEVIERKQSREKVIMKTQKDAFCSDQVRNEL